MPSPACAFDHCILAVRDLAAASALFAGLGFTLSPPGRHPGRGTANACIMFANGYIELLGVDAPDCRETFLLDFLAAGEGISAVALAPDSAERAHGLLVAWGADDRPCVIGSRAMATPEGPREVRFRVCRIAGQPILPGRVFFCEHLDRDLVYAPSLLRHANGASGIAGLTVLGDPVATLSAARCAALGLRRHDDIDGVTLLAGEVALRVTSPHRRQAARPAGQMRVPELRLRLPDRAAIAAAAGALGLAVAARGRDVAVTAHGVDLVLTD